MTTGCVRPIWGYEFKIVNSYEDAIKRLVICIQLPKRAPTANKHVVVESQFGHLMPHAYDSPYPTISLKV
jgi:hypothetical protein